MAPRVSTPLDASTAVLHAYLEFTLPEGGQRPAAGRGDHQKWLPELYVERSHDRRTRAGR